MHLSEILSPALCFAKLEGKSQKRIFETIAKKISDQHEDLNYSSIFDALSARERLGSTGLGDGVAIPHCRINRSDSSSPGIAAVVTMYEPIDFEAPDQKPVDILVFLMVTGEANQDHLDTLAKLAGILSQEDNRAALRSAPNSNALCDLLVSKSS